METVYELFCPVSDIRYDFKPHGLHITPVLTMFSAEPEALFSIRELGRRLKSKTNYQ